jgi:hypothetical protein
LLDSPSVVVGVNGVGEEEFGLSLITERHPASVLVMRCLAIVAPGGVAEGTGRSANVRCLTLSRGEESMVRAPGLVTCCMSLSGAARTLPGP